ncbi:MAG: AAA family ATPase [Endomicrobiales bacterium]|nr:AAA family ATPase [Endomicrobiales bacterium]
MNIVLTGFMGTGKTAVGKLLAEKLDWQFYDTDGMIEKDTGLSIPEIFAKKGEPYFRDVESKAVKLFSVLDKAVIACGGGVALRPENMDELEKNGVVVCLTARPEVVLKRTKNSDRPLLKVKDPLSKISELLKARETYYKRCRVSIDTSVISERETAERIIQQLGVKK